MASPDSWPGLASLFIALGLFGIGKNDWAGWARLVDGAPGGCWVWLNHGVGGVGGSNDELFGGYNYFPFSPVGSHTLQAGGEGEEKGGEGKGGCEREVAAWPYGNA